MKQITAVSKRLLWVIMIVWVAGCTITTTGDSSGGGETTTDAATDVSAPLDNVVYFDYDESTLPAAARELLDAYVTVLGGNTRSIRLEGHADERGTREYNIALGDRRGNAVANYLTANGIAGYRIEVVSYGEERPVALGSNEASWSRNRRVEIQ